MLKKWAVSFCYLFVSEYTGGNYRILVGDALVQLTQFQLAGQRFDLILMDLTDVPIDTSYYSGQFLSHLPSNIWLCELYSAWVFIALNSQSRQNRNVKNMDMSWMLKATLKIMYGLFFWDLKKAVYSSTFSFYDILKKVTIPVFVEPGSLYENSGTGEHLSC
jgi:hypothetical protein